MPADIIGYKPKVLCMSNKPSCIFTRRSETNLKKAMGMWKTRALGVTYFTWKSNAKETARNGRLLRRFAGKMNRRKLLAAWAGWEDKVKQIKANKVKVEVK